MFDTLIGTLSPQISDLLALALLAIFGLIAQTVRSIGGLQAEKIWREALHSALETGAARSDGPQEARVTQAVEYARRTVPDAIRKLKPTNVVLSDLALSKVRKVISQP